MKLKNIIEGDIIQGPWTKRENEKLPTSSPAPIVTDKSDQEILDRYSGMSDHDLVDHYHTLAHNTNDSNHIENVEEHRIALAGSNFDRVALSHAIHSLEKKHAG